LVKLKIAGFVPARSLCVSNNIRGRPTMNFAAS